MPPIHREWAKDLQKYDGRRGVLASITSIEKAKASSKSTVSGGMRIEDWPLDDLKAILQSDDARQLRISRLVDATPAILCREAFDAVSGSTALVDPLADVARRAFTGATLSLDLWHQYADWQW